MSYERGSYRAEQKHRDGIVGVVVHIAQQISDHRKIIEEQQQMIEEKKKVLWNYITSYQS
jgi:diaminopimelate decarboxylase